MGKPSTLPHITVGYWVPGSVCFCCSLVDRVINMGCHLFSPCSSRQGRSPSMLVWAVRHMCTWLDCVWAGPWSKVWGSYSALNNRGLTFFRATHPPRRWMRSLFWNHHTVSSSALLKRISTVALTLRHLHQLVIVAFRYSILFILFCLFVLVTQFDFS